MRKLPVAIDVVYRDHAGNFWRETLPINAALLAVLRFARTNPDGTCSIEFTLQESNAPDPKSATDASRPARSPGALAGVSVAAI
jgi:hypothetical protein